MKVLTFLDLTQNELRNARLQNLATPPSSPVAGQTYHDTTLNLVGHYTGSRWLYVTDQYVSALAVDGTTLINSGTALAPSLRVGAIPESAVTNLVTDLASKVATSSIGSANGVAGLDGGGKVPTAQLPASVTGGMVYQGTWNASTNTPALTSSTGTKGYLYKVSVAGTTTLDGVSVWSVGDQVVFDGTVWDKIDGQATEVVSVNGRVGAVTLTKSDIPGVVGKFAANVPAITGGTAVVIAHGLGTADCTAVVQDTSGNLVYPDINLTSTNVSLTFTASYAANTYRVIVTG